MRIGSSRGGLKLAEDRLERGRCFHYHLELTVILPTTQTGKSYRGTHSFAIEKKVSNDGSGTKLELTTF